MVVVVWRVEDVAERVLRERRAFRDSVCALPAPPCDLDAAELIYGELVANAVRYAKGRVEVRLELCDDVPVLVVRDHGPGLDGVSTARPRDAYAESGRGLDIVATLARSMAVEPAQGGGTIVRATLPCAA